MAYKPADFFVSVIDIFGVLLPGSLFMAIYAKSLSESLVGVVDQSLLHGSNGVAMFLVGAYLFGHILFLIGSLLDSGYSALLPHVVPKKRDQAFDAVDGLRKALLGNVAGAFTTYQWCITFLRVRKPAHLAPIERLEADSKFFRSLVPVFIASVPPLWRVSRGGLVSFVSVLAGLALWRFAERRWKSNQLAYWLVIEEARELGIGWVSPPPHVYTPPA